MSFKYPAGAWPLVLMYEMWMDDMLINQLVNEVFVRKIEKSEQKGVKLLQVFGGHDGLT